MSDLKILHTRCKSSCQRQLDCDRFFIGRGGFVFPTSLFSLLLFWESILFPVKREEYPWCCLLQHVDFTLKFLK